MARRRVNENRSRIADKVTLLEFTRASLRLLFVIPGFYPILDIWEFITGTPNDHPSLQQRQVAIKIFNLIAQILFHLSN